MRRSICFLVALVMLAATSSAHADWLVIRKGTWPKSWPAALERLRNQSHTCTGGEINKTFHEIRFRNRKQFEAAWPHLLKVKTPGAPVVLVRGPHKFVGTLKAGVRVHVALPTTKPVPAGPVPGASDFRTRWRYTTWIELVVDGKVVDPKRIALPAKTPIIDLRPKKRGGK